MGIVNRAIASFQDRIQNRFKKRSFALNQIDLKLLAYLDFEGGFFIEAGANDGIDQSNTYYFERYMKWRGLLIEPIPELAERCRENRPRCIIESCALVPFDHDQPYIDMRYCNLMSLVKGARKSEQEELDHIQGGCEVQSVQTYQLKVPTRIDWSLTFDISIRRRLSARHKTGVPCEKL